ncbi:uncharacterized protein LOC144106182 [Amblyomma americanum]
MPPKITKHITTTETTTTMKTTTMSSTQMMTTTLATATTEKQTTTTTLRPLSPKSMLCVFGSPLDPKMTFPRTDSATTASFRLRKTRARSSKAKVVASRLTPSLRRPPNIRGQSTGLASTSTTI